MLVIHYGVYYTRILKPILETNTKNRKHLILHKNIIYLQLTQNTNAIHL